MSEILNIFAEALEEFTKKTHILNRALLKLSIKDDLGDKNPNSLTMKDWQHVILNGLKNRMQRIDPAQVDTVTKKILQLLMKNQSLITMSNF